MRASHSFLMLNSAAVFYRFESAQVVILLSDFFLTICHTSPDDLAISYCLSELTERIAELQRLSDPGPFATWQAWASALDLSSDVFYANARCESDLATEFDDLARWWLDTSADD